MLPRCNRTKLVIQKTQHDAEIALEKRMAKNKGETKFFKCPHGNHYHLSRS